MRIATTLPADTKPEVQRAALQADIDAGGVLNIPGKYLIDRPLIIDQSNVEIRSDNQGSIQNVRGGGCLLVGIKRKPLSADHWPGGGAIRTCGDSRVFFQSSPWSKLAPQMTISCQVTANRGWGTDQTPICGSMFNGEPGPWYIKVVNGGTKLAFVFKTADGVIHTALAPMSGTVLDFAIDIDLTLGRIIIYHDLSSSRMGDVFILNNSAWYPSDTALFQIGAVSDGIIGPNPYDLTVNKLSIGPIPGTAPWARLVGPWNADSPPGQPFVHSFGLVEGNSAHGYGFFLGDTGNEDTIGENSIQDLRLVAGSYGQSLGIGLATDLLIERCHFNGGRHNVGTVNAGASYPLHFRHCTLSTPTDVNLYARDATISATGLTLKYPARAAAILKGCDAAFTDTFVTDAPDVRHLFLMLDNRGDGGKYRFVGGDADFEGKGPQSYWHCERHANTPITSLRVEDWVVVKLAGPAHVVLTDSILPQPKDHQSRCFAAIDKWLTVQRDACWG